MTSAKEYKFSVAMGPGGIRCPCCNAFHSGRSQRTTKQALNRHFRRKAKVSLVEREAIRWFSDYGDFQSEARRAEVLRGLLERLG